MRVALSLGGCARDQRPDKEEASAGIGDPAGDADTLHLHVGDGDNQRKESSEEGDDVPGRRSASTNVPYNQTTKMGTAVRFVSFPGSIARTMSSAVGYDSEKLIQSVQGLLEIR
jgi:hypothetical protein